MSPPVAGSAQQSPDSQGSEEGAAVVLRTFEALRDRLVGTAYHVLGAREDALDAVQDAFVKCWNKREDVETTRNFEGWVFTVVLNAAKDLRRRRKVRRTYALPEENGMSPPSTQPAPETREPGQGQGVLVLAGFVTQTPHRETVGAEDGGHDEHVGVPFLPETRKHVIEMGVVAGRPERHA